MRTNEIADTLEYNDRGTTLQLICHSAFHQIVENQARLYS